MKKILLSAGLMLAAVAMQAADFSATLLGGEFFFNIVDEDAATCEFAPNPNEPYNITLTGPWLPSTVNYNGKDYTIIGVGVEAFKDGYVTNGANNTTAQQREFWGFPTTLTYVRADAFNGFRSNFPAILRGNVTEFDATAMRNNKINAINTAGQAGTYLSTSQVQGYKVNVDDSYTATSALAASAGSIIYKVLDGDDKVLVAYPGDHRRTYHHFYQSGVDIFQFTNPDLYNELITEVNASGYVEIGDYAFYGNENVTKVNFDDALTTIGAHAFENSVLTTLTLPATITTIGEDAFKGVTTLTSITCNAATPPAVVFEDAVYAAIAENEQITVPEESLAAYQADENWGRFWAAAPPAAPKMYIAGTFTDWANGKLEMTENEGVYTITVNGITDGAEFKFIEGDENPVWYGGDAEGTTYGVHSDWCTDIPLSTTGVNFKISGGGDLTFTVSADKKLTVTGWPEPANELYLAGSMTNWDTDKEAMTLDNDGKFTITKEMAAGAEFKFIDQDGTWIGGDADGNFIVNEAQVVEGVELSLLLNGGNNFQIPVAGTWTLTVDKTTMKLVISGEWYAPKYAITIDENIQNGTVEADLAEAEEGETVTLTVTPAEGYQLETITVTPETLDLIVEVNNNEFTMPADNVTVTATFSLIPPTKYAITIDENIENGTVTADKAEAEESETVTLTVTPAEGYQLKTITVTGVNTDVLAPVDENNQFEMPADDVFVTAEFEEIPPVVVESAVTFSAEIDHATIEVSVDGTPIESGALVAEGTEVTITVTPEEGYKVAGVTVETVDTAEPDGPAGMPRRADVNVNGEDNVYTFDMPGEPININVTMEQEIVTGVTDLNISANKGVKYVNVMGQVSDRPFNGVNIVIDGDKTYKVIK